MSYQGAGPVWEFPFGRNAVTGIFVTECGHVKISDSLLSLANKAKPRYRWCFPQSISEAVHTWGNVLGFHL